MPEPTLPPASLPNTDGHYEAPVTGKGYLRLRDNLDDPQGYCVDVAGFGANIRLDAPLQAHTCKGGAADQLFEMEKRRGGAVRLSAYSRCLTATASTPGSTLVLASCGEALSTQSFAWLHGEHLALSDVDAPDRGDLCIAVAAGTGEPAGGRNHLRRDLGLYECDGTDPSLTAWELVKQ